MAKQGPIKEPGCPSADWHMGRNAWGQRSAGGGDGVSGHLALSLHLSGKHPGHHPSGDRSSEYANTGIKRCIEISATEFELRNETAVSGKRKKHSLAVPTTRRSLTRILPLHPRNSPGWVPPLSLYCQDSKQAPAWQDASLLTGVLLLLPGELVDSGADVLPQALDDAGQGGHAALVQVGEKLVLVLVYARRPGFDVSQVDVILLGESIAE